jgi:hypothetical protein
MSSAGRIAGYDGEVKKILRIAQSREDLKDQ